MEEPQPVDPEEGSSRTGNLKRKRQPHTSTNQQSSIKRPKTDSVTEGPKREATLTPRRSARLLAKRVQKESSQSPPNRSLSKLQGRSAKRNSQVADTCDSVTTVTGEGDKGASVGSKLQFSRLRSRRSNESEQQQSTPGSVRGRAKLPAKSSATVRGVSKRSSSSAQSASPQKKAASWNKEVDSSEPDCGENSSPRSVRKGKRSSSAALLPNSPPSKRKKSAPKASSEAAVAGGRKGKRKQGSDVNCDSPQPSSSRAGQRGKDNQSSRCSRTSKNRHLKTDSSDSEADPPKITRKGKSPAKSGRSPTRPKRSPLATAKETLEGKVGVKGKGRGSSSKGKGRAGSAASSERRPEEGTSSGLTYSLPPFAEFARLTMASEGDHDPPFPPSGTGGNKEGPSTSGGGATASSPPSAEGESKSLDPFTAMGEESKRLQMMLEVRGLPPHLLGSLGSKMHYILQKSMSSSISSSNNSQAQQLLAGIETMDDETLQLQSCIELGQLLVMGNEDTLSGFPVKQAVPSLIKLLSMEHNFDMMLNACRALTYMMEALPRSTVVVAEAIPLLIEKLQVIQCMDVAEQALSSLELLSRRHGKDILQAGGLSACLLYLDFFSIATQRCALSVAANCCQSVMEEDFSLVADSLPILTSKLQHQDKRSVESCCLCFSRLVENSCGNPKVLQEIASHGLLPNLQQLLVISPPVISMNTFVMVLKVLSTLCTSCPGLAVELLRLNMADTLRYLLVGSEEISLENIELMSRSPSEVYEILSVASEMMPPLPKDGIFEVEEILTARRHSPTTVQWQWQENDNSWRPYSRVENRIIEASHQAHEEECSIAVMGRAYVVDLTSMQQINEDSGTTRSVRRFTINPVKNTGSEGQEEKKQEEDARTLALSADPSLSSGFVYALFGALYEVFNSMAGPAVRNKCLKTILRILYHTDADVLSDILKEISISSLIATMLKAQDYRVVVGAMQMADVLIQKLPDIFAVFFHREGVMHQMKTLRDHPLKMLTTPKKEITTPTATPPSVVSTTTSESSQTPTSTRKRLSDIFRKGRRHFRRTLTRGRSDEQDPRSHTPPLPPHTLSSNAEGKPPSTPPPPTSAAAWWLGGGGAGSSAINVPSASGSKPPGGGAEAGKEKGRTDTPEGVPSLSAIGGGSGGVGVKEHIQDWIQHQATRFLEHWNGSTDQNPSLEVVSQLSEAAQQLDLPAPSCTSALTKICAILMDSVSSVSAFEFMYCKVHVKLMSFLTTDSTECAVPLNVRLRQFLHIFMGLPEQDSSLATWSPPMQVGLVPLLHQLHSCINQLEQLPVKVHDLPGRRGSQALRFFNTHQIKCTLERHPSALHTSHWKGGPLRIDPLATVQTLERYMMIRGFGRPDYGKRLDDLDEVHLCFILQLLGGVHGQGMERHHIEFLIGDYVLPYNMTIFQSIKQFAVGGVLEGEEDMMPLGRPEIWIRSHTIHYRNIPPSDATGAGPSSSRGFSSSLPSSPLTFHHSHHTPTLTTHTHTGRKSWSTGGPSSRRRVGSAKLPPSTPSGPPMRITRSHSNKERIITPSLSLSPSLPPFPPPTSAHRAAASAANAVIVSETPREKEKVRLPPLHQAIQRSLILELGISTSEDPSLLVIRLMSVLYALNNHWTDLYQGLAGNPIVPAGEFVSNKLTAKATRQLQDPLNVMTGNFPQWLHSLAKKCPFLFPFECRQMLFYLTTFDRDRAIARLQEQQPELSTGESSQTVTPRFDKKKRCVSRDNLLEQAEKLMNDLASNRALLEVHYEDEVGTGLGPTLEFYALVSRELQRSDLMLWRGDPCPIPGAIQGASSTPQYAYSPVGLFPCPIGPSTRFSIVEEICSKFRFLGKFMAKAIMDSRMLDIPLSEAFYKWLLGLETTFTAQDLQHVDPVVARSFAQLAAVAVKKHALESDPLLSGKALAVGIDSLTLEGGGSIEELDLDFTLPGYPDLELKPGGKDVPVTIHNLDDYLKLVVDWTLVRGVGRQMEAFKEGFNSVFLLSSLQGLLYPGEMDMLICGAHHQKWDIKELMDCCRPDHGYSHDSRAVQILFEVLSTYDTTEQRQFVQFVTGSPRLPVGGFKALSPPLTIVRKTVDSPGRPDEFLPSVMTCVNYLKLPDYSSPEIMRERLRFALQEGKHSFHLS